MMTEMNNNQAKDILADVLRVGDLGSRIICRPELFSSWGLLFPPENRAYFHIIKKGSCLFVPQAGSKTSITLHQGDVLFIPKVNNYSLQSSHKIKPRNYLNELKRLKKKVTQGEEKVLRMICGSYELRSNMSMPFFSLLPSYIHLTNEDLNRFPELAQTVQMLIREDCLSSIGSDLIVARLLDIFLIQIVRFWLTHCKKESSGWLAATLDNEIGNVLSIMHKFPEQKWNVESLAKEVAISRTKLFTKFTKVVGISPIQYLTNWRIELSKQMLSTTNFSILEIANNVGYESEAAFGRVFKKLEQTSPGKYRQKA